MWGYLQFIMGILDLSIYPDLMMKIRLSEEVSSNFIHRVINCSFSQDYFIKNAIRDLKHYEKN